MYGIIAHGKQWNVIYFLILFMPDQGDLPPYSCSLIVHLHLNRHPLPAFLSYLRQSERSRRLLVGSFHEKLESFRKTVIDIKQWFVINLGCHKTQINLCGCFIRFLIQPVQQCTYHLTVKVDRCHPSDITAIYRLITIGIETLSSATIRNQLFTASQIIHRPECSGNRLTQCIQTDL